MFGLECHAAAELAAAEIDAAGGVAGRIVEFVHVDGSGDPAAVAATIGTLLESGSIDAVTGWHLSNARQAIAKVVGGRVPYVYAAAYEGGERSDGVLCSGEVPGDQVVASLHWLRAEERLRQWFIVGNDYVWPRGTAAATRVGLRDTGIEILGERFLPLDTHEPACWDRVLNEIVRSGAHGVISLLVGSDAVRFNRAFGDKGLDATITRFSPFTDETVILASGADATANLFVSAGWFAGLDSASAVEFAAGFGRAFDLVNGIGPAEESVAPPLAPWPRRRTPGSTCSRGSPAARCRRSRMRDALSANGDGTRPTGRSTCTAGPRDIPSTWRRRAVSNSTSSRAFADRSPTAQLPSPSGPQRESVTEFWCTDTVVCGFRIVYVGAVLRVDPTRLRIAAAAQSDVGAYVLGMAAGPSMANAGTGMSGLLVEQACQLAAARFDAAATAVHDELTAHAKNLSAAADSYHHTDGDLGRRLGTIA